MSDERIDDRIAELGSEHYEEVDAAMAALAEEADRYEVVRRLLAVFEEHPNQPAVAQLLGDIGGQDRAVAAALLAAIERGGESLREAAGDALAQIAHRDEAGDD